MKSLRGQSRATFFHKAIEIKFTNHLAPPSFCALKPVGIIDRIPLQAAHNPLAMHHIPLVGASNPVCSCIVSRGVHRCIVSRPRATISLCPSPSSQYCDLDPECCGCLYQVMRKDELHFGCNECGAVLGGFRVQVPLLR